MVRSTRLLLSVGIVIYVSSFFLPAVGSSNPYEPGKTYLADWVLFWFFWPIIYLHSHSLDYFLSDLTVQYASLVLNAWLVPLFVIVLAFLVVDRTPRLNRILRYSVLLLVPFCWLLFLRPQNYYPREGYVLWTAGMLLVLLSGNVRDGISHRGKQVS